MSNYIQAILEKCLVIFWSPHCIKGVRIPRFFGAYFAAFGLNPNSGKYTLEKLQIRTRLTQCKFFQKSKWFG